MSTFISLLWEERMFYRLEVQWTCSKMSALLSALTGERALALPPSNGLRARGPLNRLWHVLSLHTCRHTRYVERKCAAQLQDSLDLPCLPYFLPSGNVVDPYGTCSTTALCPFCLSLPNLPARKKVEHLGNLHIQPPKLCNAAHQCQIGR